MGLLQICLPLETGINIAFQVLPDTSFSVLLCISSPAAASLARLHSPLLLGFCLVYLCSHLMGAVELFFLPTQNNSCIAKVDFFLPSWRPALWDSSLSSLPSGVTPQSPASWHGSHFPLLSCFLYPGQMLRCPLLCALNRFQHMFQQFNPPLYSFCKEHDRAMRKYWLNFKEYKCDSTLG